MKVATLICTVALALLASPANAMTALRCLSEAVLAESTLAREPIEADKAVAYSIMRRVADGRWGDDVCQVVNRRYVVPKARVGKRRGMRKTTVCDYSYKCIARYVGILKRASEERRQQALLAAQAVISGEYQPRKELRPTLHYMFRKHADTNGALWFDCTAKELGKADPTSVHVHYRDQTDAELDETLREKPGCTKYIQAFRLARDNNNKRPQVFASR